MNGLQIATLLSLDPATARYYKGFAWKDTQEVPSRRNSLYILNTDVEGGRGDHWCVMFCGEDQQVEFFDPFGSPSAVYGFESVREDAYNDRCLQSVLSKACGYHCIFYAFHRCRGVPLPEIVKMYSLDNWRKNDEMVEKFVTSFGSGYKIRKF